MLIVGAPGMVEASPIFFSPDSAAASNTNATGTATNLIDGTGLPVTPGTLANIGSIAHSDGITLEVWRGDLSAIPITLTFDFVSPTDISLVGLWQGFGDREGTGNFQLRFWDGAGGMGSEIGSVYSDELDPDATYDGMSTGSNQISLFGRAFDVGQRDDVSSMTMLITSIAVPFSPFVHLGEVKVAVPEPSTYVALFGLAITGLCFRQRRKR